MINLRLFESADAASLLIPILYKAVLSRSHFGRVGLLHLNKAHADGLNLAHLCPLQR